MKSFRRIPAVLCVLSVLCASLFVATPQALATDLSVTPANVAMSSSSLARAIIRPAGTGMTITAGQSVYLSTTDNKFYLCDNNVSLAASKVYGIALNGATAGQPVKVCSRDPAFVIGATVVIGDTIWTSGTAGGITKTSADNVTGMYISCLGVAVSTTEFSLNITRADAVKP